MGLAPVYVWLKAGSAVVHLAQGRGPTTACGVTIHGDGRWATGTVPPMDRRECGRCRAMASDVAAAAAPADNPGNGTEDPRAGEERTP